MCCRTYVWVLPATVWLTSCLPAQTPCSIESVRGFWAYSTGVTTLIATPAGSQQPVAAPLAMLGVFRIDEQGRLTGWSNSMLAGEYGDTTVVGTVEVNPNCTGTLRARVTRNGAANPVPGEAVSRIAVVDGGNGISAMTVTGIFGKHTGMESYRRITRNSADAPKCTTATVVGTYATAVDGIVLMPAPAPYSGIGGFTIDSRGQMTGSGFASVAGQLVPWQLAECSIEVFEDCTGIVTSRFPQSPVKGIEKVVILEGGDEIRSLTIQNPTGKSITPGVWKRISKDTQPVVW